MSTTDYEDFVYSSEEENQQTKEQDNHDLDEEGSVGSDHISVETDHLNDDVDKYASFNTDLEKYQYDQLQWNGIPNLRKYTIAQKNDKGETKGPKRKGSKEDEPETTVKRRKRSKSKSLPRSTSEDMIGVKAPGEPTVNIPKEGKIHFDTKEDLWYTYKKIDIYISGKRANCYAFSDVF